MRTPHAARPAIAFVAALTLLVPAFALAPPVAAETITYLDQFGTSGGDSGRSIAADASGNRYIAGETAGALPNCTPDPCTFAGGQQDVFVRKYAADGSVAWTREFGSSANDPGYSLGIGLDLAGNVYVAGETGGTLPGQTRVGSSLDGFLVKFDPDGTLLWMRQFGLFGEDSDYAGVAGLAVDSSGNSYVTGEAWDLAYTTDVAYVRKYDASGVEQWTAQLATVSSEDWPMPRSIALSPSGGVVAIGGSTWGALPGETSTGGTDAFIATFAAADGTLGWVHQWGTAAGDQVLAVAIDSTGRLVVSGAEGWNPSYVRVFAADGTPGWSATLSSGPGLPTDTTGYGLAIGPADQIAVGGDATAPGTMLPGVWLYDADGALTWWSIQSVSAIVEAVAYVPGGDLYATGHGMQTLDGLPNAGQADAFLMRVSAVETTPPTVTLAQKADQADPTNGSPVDFTLVADEALDTTTVTAGDFIVTNGTIGTIDCSGTPTTCTIPVTPTEDGPVGIAPSASFSVADLAGNAQTSAGGSDRTVTYDTTGPTITAKTKSQGTKVTIAFTVLGSVAPTECALADDPYAACASPWTGTFVKGTYTLHIRASDALGNVTVKDVTFTIKSGGKVKP